MKDEGEIERAEAVTAAAAVDVGGFCKGDTAEVALITEKQSIKGTAKVKEIRRRRWKKAEKIPAGVERRGNPRRQHR